MHFRKHSEREAVWCDDHKPAEPMVFQMSNGYFFRIDSGAIAHAKTLHEQLKSDGRVEIKFCVRDDYYVEPKGMNEQWEIVFFPMYAGDREITHGEIVSSEDSAVNGNLVIEGRHVTNATTNHVLMDYEEVEKPVLDFAVKVVENYLNN